MVSSYKRKPANLQVITNIEDILKQCIKLVGTEFLPIRFNKTMNDFVDDCKKLYYSIHIANGYRTTDKEQLKLRMKHCYEMGECFKRVQLELQMFLECFNVEPDKLSELCLLVEQTEPLVKGYINKTTSDFNISSSCS